MFNVCAERCNECLFTPTRIVSVARMRRILQQCAREDSFFECHKHTLRKRSVCCRGDYDRDPHRTNLMRIAHRLGVVRFVTEDGTPVPPEAGP